MTSDPRALMINGLTDPLRQILRQQDISPGNPGPILNDFQALLDAIGPGMPTSSKYYAFPQGRHCLTDASIRLGSPALPDVSSRR